MPRRRRSRILAAAATIGLATASFIWTDAATARTSADYPTWAEVQSAQAAESSTKALIAQIQAQLATLAAEVTRTEQIASEKGAIWAEAQIKVDEQGVIVAELSAQAEAASAEADTQRNRTAQLLAATARTGGVDLTSNLLLSSSDPSELLDALSISDKVAENASQLYGSALIVMRNAAALTAQAEEAKNTLVKLTEASKKAFDEAQAAAAEAAAQLAAQQENEARLSAQLAVLTEKRQATEADYIKGIQEQWGPGAAGMISSTGWARPARGYITSGFGRRVPPVPGASRYHLALDLSGPSYCGSPIYAAHGGTVTYAGPNGGLGNYIQIDHGNGYVTGYAHLQNGGIGVSIGDSVGPGQNIGNAGTTGLSTGCHLHFILRDNGTPIDPLAFLRDQGVVFG
ncbi:MAG: M23 family metallopeptidase [Microbacteriaceae bacterium]